MLDNTVRLHFIDESRQEREKREGVHLGGVPLMPFVGFVKLDGTPREIARLLFVKGKTWEYENEVRLLVDNKDARLLGHCDKNGFPIRVIDVPNEAIQEVYVGFNTPSEPIQEIAKIINRSNHEWDLRYITSHAFQMRTSLILRHNSTKQPAAHTKPNPHVQSSPKEEYKYSVHFESKDIFPDDKPGEVRPQNDA